MWNRLVVVQIKMYNSNNNQLVSPNGELIQLVLIWIFFFLFFYFRPRVGIPFSTRDISSSLQPVLIGKASTHPSDLSLSASLSSAREFKKKKYLLYIYFIPTVWKKLGWNFIKYLEKEWKFLKLGTVSASFDVMANFRPMNDLD